MVHTEKAYIRHYKRNDKKNNRIIKTVEVRGLKNNTKFKDKQEIIIISKQDFDNLNNDLNKLRETNNKIMSELSNKDYNTKHENTILYNKLFELMEIVNNRNELLLSANDNINLMIDNIINELQHEHINLIQDNNKEIKARLETFITSLIDKANTHQKQQNNKIFTEVKNIENEIKEANTQLNNMSLLDFIRKRKQININLDLDKLKSVSNDTINYSELDINVVSDKLFKNPDFYKLDHVKLKENSKNKISFHELYIKLEHDKM